MDPAKRKRADIEDSPEDTKPQPKRTDTDDKSKSTKENPSEGDFPSAWEPSAAAAPAGDDLWTFPAENDNDYSNYNTEGGFAAAFEGVGFDVAVFEEDKVISFQDTGSSLFPGGDTTDGDEKPASSAKEESKLELTSYAGNGEKDEDVFYQARLKGVWKFVAHNNAEGTSDAPGSYVNIATNSNLRVNRPKASAAVSPRILIRHAETYRLVLNSALFNGMRLDKNPPRRLAVEGLYYDEVKEEKPEFPTMYLLKFDSESAMLDCFAALESLSAKLPPKQTPPAGDSEGAAASADTAAFAASSSKTEPADTAATKASVAPASANDDATDAASSSKTEPADTAAAKASVAPASANDDATASDVAVVVDSGDAKTVSPKTSE